MDVKPWKQVSLQHVSFSCYTFLYGSLYFMLPTCLRVSRSSLFCITSSLFLLFNCPSSITPFFYMHCLSFLLPSCFVHSPYLGCVFFFFLPCPPSSFFLILLFHSSILIFSPSYIYLHHVYFQTPFFTMLHFFAFSCHAFSWVLWPISLAYSN